MNKNKAVLSIDLGGSKLMAGIIDYSGKVICKVKKPLDTTICEDELIKGIFEVSMDSVNKCFNLGIDGIDCIGVAVPGLADTERGLLVYACFSGIRNLEIGRILSEKFKVPVFVGNDVNVCACGEKLFGVCKDISDFIWITVSNGIGGALVLNGELYEGAFRNAGEIGHFNVEEDGDICGCGNKGCLEAQASGVAISRRYMERNEIELPDIPTAKTIAQAARRGESLAVEIYRETGYYLGKAISYAVNLINPQKVILGGGVSLDIDLFLPEIYNVIGKMVFREANKNLRIEKTGLGYDAALIGAAAFAIIKSGGCKNVYIYQ